MQLWERKKFALDDDVNAYLSFPVRNFAYPGLPVTFRQLLTHTSSIADGPAYEKSYVCGDSRVPLGQWLRDYLTAGGALYDPQRNFHSWKPGGLATRIVPHRRPIDSKWTILVGLPDI
jgi:CubicO group peptidase (beta-lactamase class C family)